VAFRDIREWRFFAVDEIPLTWLDGLEYPGRAAFSSSWRGAQLNRNIEGGPLECSDRVFAWGFGVHAPVELQFALHPIVASVRTSMGLDRAADNGGCARGSIATTDDSRDQPIILYRSELVVGSSKAFDTERLLLPKLGTAAKLLLIADAADRAEDNLPPDADPLDIRDTWDWLEPTFELDPALLEAELARRAAAAAALKAER